MRVSALFFLIFSLFLQNRSKVGLSAASLFSFRESLVPCQFFLRVLRALCANPVFWERRTLVRPDKAEMFSRKKASLPGKKSGPRSLDSRQGGNELSGVC